MRICAKCEQPILAGQLYVAYRLFRGKHAVRHVACPSTREVKQARLWGRWA